MLRRYSVIVFLIIAIAQINVSQLHSNHKTIAITMDDLPLNIASQVSNSEMRSIVERLLEKIKREKTPVTAFVNEHKLEVTGVRDPERMAILKLWFDAGVDLGNHTYAHKSQNQIPVNEAKEDILRGERSIKELHATENKRPKYFRHPYLHTGRDSSTRNLINTFLDSLGYTIAPVTVDNAEWIFSAAYDKALAKNDSALMESVGEQYITYMRKELKYFEWMSDTLFHRPIRQVLLIHSNRLNSFYYSALCAMIRSEGYSFISVEVALKDEAYRSPDTFYGGGGISWLERWALTRGYEKGFFSGDPKAPQNIMELAGVEYE
ncbi:MAG: polysaccharide deacetylase family protein [Bacteroidota bacterium]